MKGEFSLGICFNNADPLNHGRILVAPYEEYKGHVSYTSIENAIDRININSIKYQKWSDKGISSNKTSDPYVARPFLPNQISIIPKPGQVVRLIRFDDNTLNYVGPVTQNPLTLNTTYFEENTGRKFPVTDTISNSINDTVFSGYNNEQISLGNDRVLLRLDHLTRLPLQSRKKTYPIFQLSKFTKTTNYTVKDVTETVKPDVFLDYIIEITFDYNIKEDFDSKNIVCSINLYNTLELVTTRQNNQSNVVKGLMKKGYSRFQDYTSGSNNNQYTVNHTLEFNDVGSIDKAIEDILSSYKTKKIKYYNPQLVGTQIIAESQFNTITLNNRIPFRANSAGANHDTPDEVADLKNFVVRINPNSRDLYTNPSADLQTQLNIPATQPVDNTTLNYVRFTEFNEFISKIKKYSNERFLGDQELQAPITTTTKRNQESLVDKEVTVSVNYSDKFLFLSSINSRDYLENANEGMSNETISKFLSNLTLDDSGRSYQSYGFIRGEKILELLDQILAIFLSHGHSIGQSEGSLSVNAVELIKNLRGEITQEINGNTTNSTTKIINHNLRLN
jgi:hypothetical protein